MSYLGTFGDFIGGFFGTIISAVALWYLYKTLNAQIDATNKIEEELSLMKKSTDLQYLSAYITKYEGLKSRTTFEIHKLNIAKQIVDELTEDLMRQKEYRHLDRPYIKFIHYKISNSVEDPNCLQLRLEECGLKDITILNDGYFFDFSQKHLPVLQCNQSFNITIKVQKTEHNFWVQYYSQFGKHLWKQNIVIKDSKVTCHHPVAVEFYAY